MQIVRDDPIVPDPIDIVVSHPNFITLPNNITLTASFNKLAYTDANYIYKWKVEDEHDKIKTAGDNETELNVYNLRKGVYPYFFYITVKDKSNGNTLAYGKFNCTFEVYQGKPY